MKMLTRKQIANRLGIHPMTLSLWSRGYYVREGKRVYFYTDKRVLTPREGRGILGNPFKYLLSDVRKYREEMKLDSK